MTDTGQIPGEGQPENAGGQPEVQQPGIPAAGPYPYAGPVDAAVGAPGTGAAPGGEEDLLLPGSQGAWNEVQPGAGMQDLYGQQDAYAAQNAYAQHDPFGPPSPYVQQAQQQPHDQTQPVPGAQQYATPTASHTPGPHETDGRDSGAFDYGAVRASLDGQEPPAPGPGAADAPGGQEAAAPEAAPETPTPHPPRRPLHLGPPEPEQSGAVRPLSDRGIGNSSPGPAQNSVPAPGSGPVPPAPQQPSAAQPEVAEAQAAQAAAAHAMQQQTEGMAQQGEFTPQQGPPTSGPEYLDFDYQSPDSLPGPQLGALPPQDEQWAYQGHQTAEGAATDHAQQAGYVTGPQLAPSAADMGLQQDPSQAGGPVESPGPVESAGASQPAPEPADGAAAASEEQQPEPGVVGQEGQEGDGRRRRGSNDSGTESTGNTWVSTPGSTAVEPIEPPARDAAQSAAESHGPGDGAAPAETDGSEQQSAAEAQQAGDRSDRSGQAETAVPAPGDADAAGIPAQYAETDAVTPDAHIPAPAPAHEQPEQQEQGEGQQKTGPAGETPSAEEAGTAAAASGSETVAGIPAQQQAEHSDASAADGQPGQAPNGEAGTPESEAGWHDAAAMVPRQGQHVEQEAESAAVRAANDGENTSQPEATAATAAAGQEQQQETEQTTDSGAAPLMNEDGPAADADADADAEGDGTTPASAPGDVESSQAPVGPPAPGFADDEREAVHRLMRERRDIRNGFRPDPIPHEVLLRVLEAAHTAPSVGHSQPWDFVVIRSEETRRAMHELAERQRDAYAKSLPKGRAKQFKEMKIEAILDTPVNIVVTADSTRGGRHTLGRHTQPQMAPYSSALAVENLWLAARAEGLGVGWVSFFDEREMVRALELPDHLEVVAYLCVGYVDEFPPEPELAQAGWSKRRPLSWVVHEESYGRRVLPGAEPQDLLSDTVAAIRPLDAKALGEAWERQKRMTKPSGALGMLEIISAQLCGLSRKCPPPLPEPAAVAIFAGDHGVHAQGVTPWPQEVTAQMVANFLGGGAVCNAFANQVGAEVCVVDVGVAGELPATPGLLPRKVRAGTADMTQGPALTREEALRAVEVGIETARDLVAAGNKALLTGEMGIANTTVSAALISACTGVDPVDVTGRGTGINDETHARKVEVVRRALELHQPDPADPLGLLAAVGGLEHAALVGLILGSASLRTPVILDGVSAGAAALVARCIAPEALAACIAGHRSSEPGHVAALTKLGLRPLVDLDLRLGEGTGALLSLPMVQSAARAMHEVATFDSAGVTGKG